MVDVLWGLGGIAAVLAVAVLASTNRSAIRLRTVVSALLTLVAFAFVVLRWSPGREALDKVTKVVNDVIGASDDGIQFLFGAALPEDGFVFAFQVLPVIVFFAALFAVLYYIGVMQVVVRILGGALRRLFSIGHIEATSAAANIFVGQSEGFLAIRPYIDRLTKSEIFSIMTVGLATVAGSVLVGYALLGVPLSYLLAATFMTAPAGLLMAKMIVPETYEHELPEVPPGREHRSDPLHEPEPPEVRIGAVAASTLGSRPSATSGRPLAGGTAVLESAAMTGPTGQAATSDRQPGRSDEEAAAELAASVGEEDAPANVFDAAAKGALDGLRVAAGVGALLVAFISLIALLNLIIGEAGNLVGIEDLTFERILGWVFSPVAFAVGVPWSEAPEAGNFLGQKLILNEFVAFADFGPQADQFSEKTVAVITFALCGFANFGSFAILLGALGELAPRRRPLVASLGLRAILAGTLANLLNAAVAGMVITL